MDPAAPDHHGQVAAPARRIGVFYDGGWYAEISDYLLVHHRWHARPDFLGLQDAFRWWLHDHDDVAFDDCDVVETHYVRARAEHPSQVFDHTLREAGIVRHDAVLAGGREKGADVMLALETFDRALTAQLDLAVVVTGDADFVPLVSKLAQHGVRTLIPTVNVVCEEAGHQHVLRSAAAFAATDAMTVPLLDVLDTALRQGPPVRYPLASPAGEPPPTTPGPRRWEGTVTRWHPGDSFGFIRDRHGRSWFASQDDVDHDPPAFPIGTPVSFAGSPNPTPGKKYPRARSIRQTATATPCPPANTQPPRERRIP